MNRRRPKKTQEIIWEMPKMTADSNTRSQNLIHEEKRRLPTTLNKSAWHETRWKAVSNIRKRGTWDVTDLNKLWTVNEHLLGVLEKKKTIYIAWKRAVKEGWLDPHIDIEQHCFSSSERPFKMIKILKVDDRTTLDDRTEFYPKGHFLISLEIRTSPCCCANQLGVKPSHHPAGSPSSTMVVFHAFCPWRIWRYLKRPGSWTRWPVDFWVKLNLWKMNPSKPITVRFPTLFGSFVAHILQKAFLSFAGRAGGGEIVLFGPEDAPKDVDVHFRKTCCEGQSCLWNPRIPWKSHPLNHPLWSGIHAAFWFCYCSAKRKIEKDISLLVLVKSCCYDLFSSIHTAMICWEKSLLGGRSFWRFGAFKDQLSLQFSAGSMANRSSKS